MFNELTLDELRMLRRMMWRASNSGACPEAWEIRFDIVKEMIIRR